MIVITPRCCCWVLSLAFFVPTFTTEAWVSSSFAPTSLSSLVRRNVNNKKQKNGLFLSQSPPPAGGNSNAAAEELTLMSNFFASRQEWMALFRTMVEQSPHTNPHPTVQDWFHQWAQQHGPNQPSPPWMDLPATPQHEAERNVLKTFLDETQQVLLDIPVNEEIDEDANDRFFVEEGKRILALNRFQILTNYDYLFHVCWSELFQLQQAGQGHSGSLILIPVNDNDSNVQYNPEAVLQSLHEFCHYQVSQPLQWLGLAHDFEVTALQRGASAPGIRLMYQLSQQLPSPPPPQTNGDSDNNNNDNYDGPLADILNS